MSQQKQKQQQQQQQQHMSQQQQRPSHCCSSDVHERVRALCVSSSLREDQVPASTVIRTDTSQVLQ